MKLIIIILIIIFSIAVHEFGHAFKAKKYNIKVININIGIGPKLFSLWWKKFPGTPIIIRLLPFGGWISHEGNVRAHNESFRNEISISGAGITFNLLLAMFCCVLLIIFNKPITTNMIILLLIIIVGGFLLIRFETFFHMYLTPVIGLIVLFFLIRFYIIDISSSEDGFGSEIKSITGNIKSIQDILIFTLVINLILGLFNMIVLMPLDGGRIISAWLKKKNIPHNAYVKYSSIIFLIIIIYDWFFS